MKQYDQRLTDEAKRALIEFKKAVYNLYVNYDSEVLAVGKPVESLWLLHNSCQDWGMVDYQGETVDPNETVEELIEQLDQKPTVDHSSKRLDCADLPMIEAVAQVLLLTDSDSDITVNTLSMQYDYNAKDLLKLVASVLRAEDVLFDIYYNDNDQYEGILRLY